MFFQYLCPHPTTMSDNLFHTFSARDDDDSQSGFSDAQPEVVIAGYTDIRLAHESPKGFARVLRAKHHGRCALSTSPQCPP